MFRNFIKFLFLFCFLSVIFSGCITSKKYLSKAEYDLAIDYAVKKIRKNSSHDKSMLILEEAFNKSNEIDNQRIKLLELDHNESNSEEIFKSCWKSASHFFSQSESEKMKVGMPFPGYPYGFIPMEQEPLTRSKGARMKNVTTYVGEVTF